MSRLILLCLALACPNAGLAPSAGTPAADKPAAPSPKAEAKAVRVWPPPRVTALEACPTARSWAYKWDPGHQLIFVTSRPYDFQFDGRSSRWGFRCVSTDGKRVACFSMDTAHVESPVRVMRNVKRPPTCLDLVNPAAWKIDSPAVWQIARRDGLDAWLGTHPGFDIRYPGNRFELAANKQDGPYWLVSCSARPNPAKKKRDRITFGISALDGRLLFRSAGR